MQKKWIVKLTSEERKDLLSMVKKGKCAAYKIKNANILLKADQSEEGENWTDVQIADAYNCIIRTVEHVRKRFVEKGIDGAIEREKRKSYTNKLDGDAEANLVSLVCSSPPKGCSRWTLKLLADRMITLEYVESISESTICRTLKKTNLSLGK